MIPPASEPEPDSIPWWRAFLASMNKNVKILLVSTAFCVTPIPPSSTQSPVVASQAPKVVPRDEEAPPPPAPPKAAPPQLHADPAPAPAPAPAPTPRPHAAVPTIVVSPITHPYPLVHLSLSDAVDSAGWDILYASDITQSIDKASLSPDGSACVFTGPPGKYRVSAWVTQSGQSAFVVASVTIPGGPPPQPPAPPVAGKFWVVGVFDLSSLFSLPAGQQAIYASPTLSTAVAPLGGYWRKFDTASPEVSSSGPPWAQAALKAGLPALVIVQSDGTVALAQSLPSDEPGVLAAVQSILSRRPTARIVPHEE